MVLKLSYGSESPGELVTTKRAMSYPRVSDSVGLEWGSRHGISNKIPGEAGLGSTL